MVAERSVSRAELESLLSSRRLPSSGKTVQVGARACDGAKTATAPFDGNGNVVSLLNADSGAVAAIYEYSPFGELLRCQTLDPTVADQPFRFSTKYYDAEAGLYYYGHRFYDPRNGRFLGRDPIEEKGGLHLYAFCTNDGINHWDVLGNDEYDDPNTLEGRRSRPRTSGGPVDSMGAGSWSISGTDAGSDMGMMNDNAGFSSSSGGGGGDSTGSGKAVLGKYSQNAFHGATVIISNTDGSTTVISGDALLANPDTPLSQINSLGVTVSSTSLTFNSTLTGVGSTYLGAGPSTSPNNAGSTSGGSGDVLVGGTAVAGTAEGGTAIGGGTAAGGGELVTAGARGGMIGVLLGAIFTIPGDVPVSRTATSQVSVGLPVYRVWGGSAGPLGPSWTPLDPRTDPQNFRALAGLPNVNTGQYLITGTLIDNEGVVYMPAVPLKPGVGGTIGGWPEVVVPSPGNQIQIIDPKINLPPPINITAPGRTPGH